MGGGEGKLGMREWGGVKKGEGRLEVGFGFLSREGRGFVDIKAVQVEYHGYCPDTGYSEGLLYYYHVIAEVERKVQKVHWYRSIWVEENGPRRLVFT